MNHRPTMVCNIMLRKTLLHRMGAGTKGFEGMYRANEPLIHRYMFWRTRDEMLAQDLTSNVFVKAWRTRKSFVGGSAKSWLYRIARTTLIDYWRKKKDLPDDGSLISKEASNAPSLEEELDRGLALEELHKALRQLPPEMYEVIRLRFIEGMTIREASKRLHISEVNVRVIQYRALKKLRSFMQ